MKMLPVVFEEREIRRLYDEKTETWFFSVVDIIQVLTQQPDYQASRKYWKVLKGRLAKEGSEVVTNCYQLKMAAADGKQRLTDVASAETLLRLIQSVPSPKAEPIKLCRVGGSASFSSQVHPRGRAIRPQHETPRPSPVRPNPNRPDKSPGGHTDGSLTRANRGRG